MTRWDAQTVPALDGSTRADAPTARPTRGGHDRGGGRCDRRPRRARKRREVGMVSLAREAELAAARLGLRTCVERPLCAACRIGVPRLARCTRPTAPSTARPLRRQRRPQPRLDLHLLPGQAARRRRHRDPPPARHDRRDGCARPSLLADRCGDARALWSLGRLRVEHQLGDCGAELGSASNRSASPWKTYGAHRAARTPELGAGGNKVATSAAFGGPRSGRRVEAQTAHRAESSARPNSTETLREVPKPKVAGSRPVVRSQTKPRSGPDFPASFGPPTANAGDAVIESASTESTAAATLRLRVMLRLLFSVRLVRYQPAS